MNSHTPWHVLRERNFRLLWVGEAISVLGDQVHFIALTWLVLQLTGNGLALGLVLALGGIPRALFILVGGALTDRFLPRTLMLLSNLLRLLLVALLAGLTLGGQLEMWMLYGFALVFGTVDACFFPAATAIIPRLVDVSHLQAANSLIQGTAQVSQLLGPPLAGAMIALLAGARAVGSEVVPELQAIGFAFVFNAATFLISSVTLWLIRGDRSQPAIAEPQPAQGMLAAIGEGLGIVWDHPVMRTLFLLSAAINFLLIGPFIVGMPVLANERFAGVAAYGLIMGAFGGGMLVGTLLAGTLPSPAPGVLGTVLLAVVSVQGIGVGVLGLTGALWLAVVASIVMGVSNGYVNVLFVAWLQSHTPQELLGRVMSLMFFASVGTMPVSLALAGILVEWNITGLFVSAGSLLTLLTLVATSIRPVRRMGLPVDDVPSGWSGADL